MKQTNKAKRLQARLADWAKTVETIKGSADGYHKPGADAALGGYMGPGKKENRVKRTDATHQRLRDLAKQNPADTDLRRYL